jgi:hypothetical protein
VGAWQLSSRRAGEIYPARYVSVPAHLRPGIVLARGGVCRRMTLWSVRFRWSLSDQEPFETCTTTAKIADDEAAARTVTRPGQLR